MERALKVLEMFLDKQCSIERTLNHMDTTDVEIWDAVYTAREALSEGPCEDAISFPKGTLKKRGKGYVVYDPEWLKENWQTELMVMGIECEDAISRAAAIKKVSEGLKHTFVEHEDIAQKMLADLPSVTPKQKMGRWIREKKHHKDDFQEFDYWDVRCSECGARKRIGWTNVRHCPMCGAKMSENPTSSTPEKEENIGPDKKS